MHVDVLTMWTAIEDAAIFDEDEHNKDDTDDSISEIRQDAGGKTKRSISRKKTNSSRTAELNNEDNSDDASPKAKVRGRRGKAKKSACHKKWTRCGDEEKKMIVQMILTQVSEQRVIVEKPRRQLVTKTVKTQIIEHILLHCRSSKLAIHCLTLKKGLSEHCSINNSLLCETSTRNVRGILQ